MDKHKTMLIHVTCYVLLAIAGEVAGKDSYVLLSPNVVRPGNDYTIQGTLLNTPNKRVTISAKLTKPDGSVVAQSSVVLTGKTDVKLDLPVPHGITVGDRKTMNLEVRATGGLSFTETKTVNFDPKSVSVYIQTDKGIYKPGQTVKFRVFGTTPDLKVVYDKLKVELFDPKGNKINQWSVSGAELTSMKGVYQVEQVMSTEPVFGEWKIKAKLLSHGDKFEERSFKVAEYVLPKFETELDLPSFGRFDVTNFQATVKAKYTFGESVKGIVDVRIKPANERFQFKNGQRISISKTIELKMQINGEVKLTLPVSQLKELGGETFHIQANVTEDLTKSRQGDEGEITFYETPIKLTIPKSLPDTFKPGLKTDVVVVVSQQDDTPPDIINGKLKVTITEFTRSKERTPITTERPPFLPGPGPIPFQERMFDRVDMALPRRVAKRSIMPPWRPEPIETSKDLPPKTYSIPVDGFVTFSVDAKKSLTRLRIKAEYIGQSVTKTFKKRHSPSNTYIQMRLLNKTPTAGQSASIEVKSTTIPGAFNYQIYARGTIVESGVVNMKKKQMTWRPRLTPEMAPRAKFVIFFVRSDGEIVADVLMINVEGSVYENKVDIKFSTYNAEPAANITLDITADAGSKVHVLGVDKSVLLLASGNDITNQQVLQELRQFDTKTTGSLSPFQCDRWCLRWPVPVGGEDVQDVFNDAGVLVITDALVYNHIEPPIWRPRKHFWGGGGGGVGIFRRGGMAGVQMMAASPMAVPDMAFAVEKSIAPDVADFDITSLAPVKRTRTLFPETWLWETRDVPANGSVSIFETVPDTITSWIASAFAVHPATGLGVANPTPQLTVKIPFFISMNLPYSVIRGEKVMIQVTLHNYSPTQLYTLVKFLKSDAFQNIEMKGKAEALYSRDISRVVKIPAGGVQSLYFPILPEQIGMMDLTIQAQASSMSDAVTKKLLVEPEGSPREYSIPIIADLKSGETITETAQITFPKGKVHGSEVVTVTVIGDIMGPSINGLDKLLKLPYGCGEQNMLNFAPNIFIIKYLEATHTANGNTLKKAKEFMEKGYQRELRYSHPDGSFSAFGDRDPSGSTWLTAFVLKSFVQAKPYIFIDDNVINKAIEWLIKQQQPDGTFNEPGRVIHKAMQGGSVGGKTSLTSYVLISLLEARVVEEVATKVSSIQSNAITYLEGQVSQTTDVYDLAIMAYALQLGGSPQADLVWNKLDAFSKTKAGTKYWEKVSNTNDIVAEPWKKRDGVAVNIELTSYALLTLVQRNDRTDGVKVLKWVTEQRNPNGGFSSTQDTVLALQGLAEMAALIYSPNHDVTVTISGTGFHDTINVNNINAGVLQTRDVPANVGTVTVTATGTGLTFIQFGVRYNIDTDEDTRSFDLTVTIPQEAFHFYQVKACARYLEVGKSSSMAVLEIHSLSGFVADVDSLVTEPAHSKFEMAANKIILYFDQIDSNQETCATVEMHRIGMVASAKPVPVQIYDYYEPTKAFTKFYVPQSLRNSEICELCGAECDVCGPK